MREHKFRGRRSDNGEWVYGHYFTPPLTDENSGLPAESGWFFLSGTEKRHCIEQDGVVYTVDPDTVGEWTGMQDDKGNLIFEDDIVRITDDVDDVSVHRVEYQGAQGYPAFDLEPDPGYDSNALSWAKAVCKIEVIGNVHQNVELLEAKRDA
ncbi:MAG: YopX family protein [Gammaproteobacteria bacterium]|nr:YopX family protein [Gammaproteobacteria bacterium]